MHLKGKNLAPYQTIRHEDIKVYVAPKLVGYASSVQLEVRGGLRKKLGVDINHEHGPTCDH